MVGCGFGLVSWFEFGLDLVRSLGCVFGFGLGLVRFVGYGVDFVWLVGFY